MAEGTLATPRYFFIHVMKTAGTVLARHLQQQFPKGTIYPSRGYDWDDPGDVEWYSSIPRLLALSEQRRAEIQIFTGHFPYWVGAELGPELRTLTVLRDPVERTVSVLKHFKRLDARFRALELEAIYEDDQMQAFWVKNHQTKVFSLVPADDAKTIMRPITIDDERFERAKQNLDRVDMVGLTEHFDEFLDELEARWHWWPDGVDRSDRVNVSPETWNASPDLRRRIAEENPYDVAFYHYAQELVAQRQNPSREH